MKDIEILREVKKVLKTKSDAISAIIKLGGTIHGLNCELEVARAEAAKWRDATMGYKYGNQVFQEGFALQVGEMLPWEKAP